MALIYQYAKIKVVIKNYLDYTDGNIFRRIIIFIFLNNEETRKFIKQEFLGNKKYVTGCKINNEFRPLVGHCRVPLLSTFVELDYVRFATRAYGIIAKFATSSWHSFSVDDSSFSKGNYVLVIPTKQYYFEYKAILCVNLKANPCKSLQK